MERAYGEPLGVYCSSLDEGQWWAGPASWQMRKGRLMAATWETEGLGDCWDLRAKGGVPVADCISGLSIWLIVPEL